MKIMRDKILRLAANLFVKYGYEGVSMSNIAKKLKITKPALYYHFRDKREIYIESLRIAITEYTKLASEAINDKGTAKERFYKFISISLGKNLEKNQLMIAPLLRSISLKDKVILNFLNEEKRKMKKMIMPLLKDMEKEYKKDFNFPILNLILIGAMNAFVVDKLFNEKVSWKDSEVVDQFVKLFC
jgi:AcrR family transcriptional regulator